MKKTVSCSIPKCSNKVIAKSLCEKHYRRQLSHGDPLYEKIIVGDDKRRFLSSFTENKTGCWEWRKNIHYTSGYGMMFLKGKQEQAHRASWILINGPIPAGMLVLHKCHNRKCVNPAHLYIGTQQQNMDDMKRAGRSEKLRGEKTGKAKTSDAEAYKIKALLASGNKVKEVSQLLKIPESRIWDIKRGRCWAWLDINDSRP